MPELLRGVHFRRLLRQRLRAQPVGRRVKSTSCRRDEALAADQHDELVDLSPRLENKVRVAEMIRKELAEYQTAHGRTRAATAALAAITVRRLRVPCRSAARP